MHVKSASELVNNNQTFGGGGGDCNDFSDFLRGSFL